MKISPNPPPVPAREPSEMETKLREVSRQFEAVFVNQMVSAMRNTVVKGGLVPESRGEKIYQGMLDQEHAQKIAESGDLGLSELIYEHLVRSAGR